MRGLDSKNTKTRLEVLDVMGSLMERHGLDVVERARGGWGSGGGAKLADQARDVGMRSAARVSGHGVQGWRPTRGGTWAG